MQGDPLINLRSKEQEAELVRQTLAALTAMRIRFPGKSEEEAESVLDEVSAFSALPRRAAILRVGSVSGRKPESSKAAGSGEAWRSDKVQVLLAVLVFPGAVTLQTPPARPLPPFPPQPPPQPPHNCCPRRLGSHCLSNDPADNPSSTLPLFPAAPRCSFILISAASSICTARTSPSFRPALYSCACTGLAALLSSRRLNKLF